MDLNSLNLSPAALQILLANTGLQPRPFTGDSGPGQGPGSRQRIFLPGPRPAGWTPAPGGLPIRGLPTRLPPIQPPAGGWPEPGKIITAASDPLRMPNSGGGDGRIMGPSILGRMPGRG
jgi:hypothetical protein